MFAKLFVGQKPDISKKELRRWHSVRLKKNPYKGDKYGLYFLTSELANKRIPTMFDTGSNFTALNWKSVKGTPVAKERKLLKQKWQINGAVGEFKPKRYVRMDRVYIGGLALDMHLFLMMDFENLPLNNYGKYPFAIAGIDILRGRDFILDFPHRKLYIDTKNKRGNSSPRIKR